MCVIWRQRQEKYTVGKKLCPQYQRLHEIAASAHLLETVCISVSVQDFFFYILSLCATVLVTLTSIEMATNTVYLGKYCQRIGLSVDDFLHSENASMPLLSNVKKEQSMNLMCFDESITCHGFSFMTA